MYTTSKRGSLDLTIVTESRTKTVTTQTPTKEAITALHRLATAGQAVIDAQAQSGATTPSAVERPAADLAAQMAQLAALHASGALTAEEFASAKQRLLSD
jgi:purine nucleoside permease